MRHKLTRRGSIAALALLGVLAAVGVAYAAIPSADGVIHSCYNANSNPSGQLRVIDAEAGARCAKNERVLNFNQVGPKGDKGDKGDAGTDGVDGIDGINGTNGTDGTDGTDGAPGPAGISTATFATVGQVSFTADDTLTKIASKTLPAGSWAIVATATIPSDLPFNGDIIRTSSCELHNPAGNVIGGTADRRVTPDGDQTIQSLSMTGGAIVAAGGGEVSLWCRSQAASTVGSAQIMMLQVGGFS